MTLEDRLDNMQYAPNESRLRSFYGILKNAPLRYKLGAAATAFIGGWYSFLGIANILQGDFAGFFALGAGAIFIGAAGDIIRAARNRQMRYYDLDRTANRAI